MSEEPSLVTILASVAINQQDLRKARMIAGAMVESFAHEWSQNLFDNAKESLINKSTKRIANTYVRKRKSKGLSNKSAARETIDEELELLKKELPQFMLSLKP
jgi:hypothetical protein